MPATDQPTTRERQAIALYAEIAGRRVEDFAVVRSTTTTKGRTTMPEPAAVKPYSSIDGPPPVVGKGIYRIKCGKWIVKLSVNSKKRYLGTYATIAEAIVARDRSVAFIAGSEPPAPPRRNGVVPRVRQPKDWRPGDGLGPADDAEVRERIAMVRDAKIAALEAEPGETDFGWTVPRMRSTVTAMPYGRRVSTVKEGQAWEGQKSY